MTLPLQIGSTFPADLQVITSGWSAGAFAPHDPPRDRLLLRFLIRSVTLARGTTDFSPIRISYADTRSRTTLFALQGYPFYLRTAATSAQIGFFGISREQTAVGYLVRDSNLIDYNLRRPDGNLILSDVMAPRLRSSQSLNVSPQDFFLLTNPGRMDMDEFVQPQIANPSSSRIPNINPVNFPETSRHVAELVEREGALTQTDSRGQVVVQGYDRILVRIKLGTDIENQDLLTLGSTAIFGGVRYRTTRYVIEEAGIMLLEFERN